jgi:integrase/recombinase XerD
LDTILHAELAVLYFPFRQTTPKSANRTDAADMLKRRLKQAGLPAHYSPHIFRATGITNFLENDGTLEAAQRIAGHADSRTTKLYDRRGQKVLLEDMERIRY